MKRTTRRHVQGFATLVILLIVLAIGTGKVSINNSPSSSSPASTLPSAQVPAGSLSLITEPAAGVAPVLGLIDSAKHSVDLVMYELEDTRVESALASAESRGVSVRVLLNKGYYGKPDSSNPNQAAYDYLQAHHVPVHWTPGYFALTHQKTMIVDGKTSIIMTFNVTPQYYTTGRDFGITDTDAKDVDAIETAFTSDWQDQKTTAPNGDDLLWSPGSETATIALINQAKNSLEIYNEEMADSKVVSAIADAAKRGVNVEVVMTDSSEWHKNFNTLQAAGVHIRTYHGEHPLYIHAKMILADNDRAFIGSENFSTTSLTKNRELGIILADKTVIQQLNATFSADYANATIY